MTKVIPTNTKGMTMTTTRKRGHSTADRVLATGLSVAACVGLVGVVGIREASASSEPDVAPQPEALSSGGYSQADLDAYAASLADQANQLSDYRAHLDQVAQQLSLRINLAQPAGVVAQPVANSTGKQGATTTKTRPKPQKPNKPNKPRTTTQSS